MNINKEVYESREDMRNALKRIEAENKALKEELKTTQDMAFELTESLRKEGIELEKIEQRRKELLKASIKFNERVLELVPFINDDRALAQNHGCDWTHGNWKTEREALVSIIEKNEKEKETK